MTGTAAEPQLEIGARFQGRYEIAGELGSGSFGRVYRARQLSTSQDVAIKILRLPSGDAGGEGIVHVDRFRREMRLCAELAHPHIVRLIDSGESSEGVLYTVFEFVPGATLRAVLAEEGALSSRETVRLMGQVLDALSCAHARGVVHRDLKPENIMITRTGVRRNALILDFGLGGLVRDAPDPGVRITHAQHMMGTPCYAAPEQLRGEPPSTRSDLYSWGLVVLECLTGQLAVSGASVQEVILKQLGPEPIPIPTWLRRQRLGRVLETVTAKDIEQRDVTIEGVLQALSADELDVPRDDRSDAPTLVPAPATRSGGERRQISVVCCRLSVTSSDGAPLDLEELDGILHARQDAIAELAGRRGGQLAGAMVDDVFVAFGYPHAHEDDARRAVRTALDIVSEMERAAQALAARGLTLRVGIGVHTGIVIARPLRDAAGTSRLDELIGATPRLAARLADHAPPGAVLVSGDTQRLLRGAIATIPSAPLPAPPGGGTGDAFRIVPGAEVVPSTDETPFVGRARALEDLAGVWARARMGTPGVVLIRGEPGIGKSRLVRELRRQVPPESWVAARCIGESQGIPLRPFVDLLVSLDEPIEPLLTRHGFNVAETMPLFAGLLSLADDPRYPAPAYSRERQKELTFTALVALLLRLTEVEPRVLVLEDLHWADPTTLELTAQLVQEVRSAQIAQAQQTRLCVVLTARPEFEPQWPTDDMVTLQLTRLADDEVAAMIARRQTAGPSLSSQTVEEIVRRADGVPLFVEEVTRVLLDARARRDTLGPDAGLAIPGTLRDLLTARLDALDARVKDTLQLAAVLGRELRYEVLRAVSRKDEETLRDDLGDLTRAGLILHSRGARSESYVFKHALMREAAYESLLRTVREELHLRVAATLQQRFPETAEHRPDVLAQHFEGGGEPETAVAYWLRSGDRALRRAAYIEAAQQLEHALALLQTAPPSPARDRLEVEVLATLGTVLFSTKGYSAEEVERIFARAQGLCEALGVDVPAKVLTGVMGVHFTRSDLAGTLRLLPVFDALTQRSDPVSAITGHATLGLATFFRGNFVAARTHLALAKPYYGTAEFQQYARAWGYDGGLLVHAYLMSTLWYLGYPDQAEALRQEMVAQADAAADPYSLLIGLSFSTVLTLRHGDVDATLQLATQVMMRSAEEKLYVWMAGAMLAQGGALLQQGQAEAAIPLMRQGLDIYRSIGLLVSYGFYLRYLADAYAAAGNPAEGLAVADEGLALCHERLASFPEAELLRAKGDLLRVAGDLDAAEHTLRAALQLARQASARSLELQAALSLAQLWKTGGRPDDAPAVLQGVYDGFSEGLDTRDLRTARALLAMS